MQRKRIIMISTRTNSKSEKKVVLGLSGGVDSTSAALLLQREGYDVTGLFIDVTGRSDCGRQEAERAASELGIELIYRDVSADFEREVIEPFCEDYAAGRTPNPCILCNPSVKFRTLIEAADDIGAGHIATGHYAGTYHDEENDLWYIRRAKSRQRDQSYMLYRLGQEVISRLLLPLYDMTDKSEVRKIAEENSMGNAGAKDSQEICFIDDGASYKDFIRARGYEPRRGDFTDKEGNVLGEHEGLLNYTIGQRKGLGIALGRPVFVTGMESETNTVVLGDNSDLFSREVISGNNIMHGEYARIGDGDISGITAKIRYAAPHAHARIESLGEGRLRTVFEEPQRAATPGQSVVFYRDDLVIGGGIIEKDRL